MTGSDDDREPEEGRERPPQTPPVPPVPPVPPAPPEPPAAAVSPPPFSGAPPEPSRTAPIAIVAFVLAFFTSVVGIVLGIIALGRVRRTGEGGRGLAIGAIVVGSVVTALGMLATVILVATLATIGATAGADPGVGSGPSVTASPPLEDPADPAPQGDETDVFALAVGDCLLEAGLTADEVETVPLVDCATAHDYEVYAEPLLADAAYPGADAVDEQAEALCYDAFEPYVGGPYETSALDYSYLTPTEGSWAAGDREVSCLVYDPAALLTGSVQGSGR